jgi:hypothetical protein
MPIRTSITDGRSTLEASKKPRTSTSSASPTKTGVGFAVGTLAGGGPSTGLHNTQPCGPMQHGVSGSSKKRSVDDRDTQAIWLEMRRPRSGSECMKVAEDDDDDVMEWKPLPRRAPRSRSRKAETMEIDYRLCLSRSDQQTRLTLHASLDGRTRCSQPRMSWNACPMRIGWFGAEEITRGVNTPQSGKSSRGLLCGPGEGCQKGSGWAGCPRHT